MSLTPSYISLNTIIIKMEFGSYKIWYYCSHRSMFAISNTLFLKINTFSNRLLFFNKHIFGVLFYMYIGTWACLLRLPNVIIDGSRKEGPAFSTETAAS